MLSTLNRSFALEEIKESDTDLVDLLPERHLSISNLSTDESSLIQVVKVSGTITVSF